MKSLTQRLYGMHWSASDLHCCVGVFQKAILSKLSKPLVAQPVSVSYSLALQAAGTVGTEPIQSATSPCTLGWIECSSHI